MPDRYLTKFRSVLPKVQGEQILKVLQTKKDSGEIQTIEEFKSELTRLTQILLSEELIPSLKLFFGDAREIIDSETYNFMLERIEDDLAAAFREANNIEDVLQAHKDIINKVVLKAIQFGINQLEERVSLYEFINGNKNLYRMCSRSRLSTSRTMTNTHTL